jgi:hypothetical protein
MPRTGLVAGLAEGGGFIAAAVIGHDALRGHPELVITAHVRFEEGDRAFLFPAGAQLRISHAGVLADADMDAFPASTSHLIAPVGGDAMAGAPDAPEFLGIQMQRFARRGTFVAHDRWRRRADSPDALAPAQSRLRQAGALRALAAGNADIGSLAYVLHSAQRGYAKTALKFQAAGSATLWEPGGTVNGTRTEVTNQLPAGKVLYGNFADLLVGLWAGMEILADRDVANGALKVSMFQDVDFKVLRPDSFCIGSAAAG